MTPRPGRRTAALVTGLGLAAGSLLVAPVAPASAAPENDSAAAVSGGNWLAGQLNADGLLETRFGPSPGLTIDAALSLDEFEGSDFDGQIAETTETLATQETIDSYTGSGTEVYSGASSKLLAFLVSQGVDPTNVDGVDLLSRVEGTVVETGPGAGRIQDTSEFGNYANNIGQTWAARGLAESGSPSAESATDFLLSQQCAAGFVPEGFGTGAGQACDPASDQPSIDTTALFVLNLAATEPAPGSDVAEAADEAADWLREQQAPNGEVGGDNSNSTGLAGWAFATVGANGPAQRAAVRVAGVQVAGFAQCEGALVPEDIGAIALGRTQFDRDVSTGIDEPAKDEQWRLASAQALPVLRSLPAPSDAGTLAQATSARYVQAGRPTTLRVSGLAAGQKDCVVGGGGAATVVGSGKVNVDVPGGTANRTYRLAGVGDSVTVRALGAKRFTVSRKNTVARGNAQTVAVRGLAAQEKVRVLFRGRQVASGTASGQGVYKTSFTVTGTKGKAPLKVTGQFAKTRFGSKAFTVR